MIDSEAFKQIQNASIEERIVIIEAILQSLKNDIKKEATPQAESTSHPQHPAFGFMSSTGKILGDVVAPVVSEDTWEVLR